MTDLCPGYTQRFLWMGALFGGPKGKTIEFISRLEYKCSPRIYLEHIIFLHEFRDKSINTSLHNPSKVTRVYKLFFIIAVMVLILASAGCAELPPGGESGWSGLLSGSEPEETPDGSDADPGYLTPATPYPTATRTMASPTLSRPPETAPTPDPYVTLSNRTAQFNATHATEAFSFDLTAPPLIIDFEVEPKMITRVMHAKSDYKDRKYQDFTQTYPSEDSWFTVTVRDSGSGKIVAQDGFGKLFSADTHKRVFVGRSGEYLIQFDGNDVKVHILVRAGGL